MQSVQTTGIDLPLKALAWQAADGTVSLTYFDPSFLRRRYALPDDVMKPIEALTTLIEQAIAG